MTVVITEPAELGGAPVPHMWVSVALVASTTDPAAPGHGPGFVVIGKPKRVKTNDDGVWRCTVRAPSEFTADGYLYCISREYPGGPYHAPEYVNPRTPRSVADGVTTNGSAVVTSATAVFTADDVGRSIEGNGIPANTTILSRQSATQVTMSANATATATGVTITLDGVQKVDSIQADAPDDLPSSALGGHLADAVGAHAASAISHTATEKSVSDTDDQVAEVITKFDRYHRVGAGPDRFPLAMRTFAAAWANRATAPVNVEVVGDSIAVGWTANSAANSWFNIAMARLARANGQRLGDGYVPIATSSSGGYTNRQWTFTGTTADRVDAGLGYNGTTLSNGATATYTTQSPCDRIWIHHSDGPLRGPFTVSIDGGAPVTVTPNTAVTAVGGRVWDSGPLTRQVHTVVITATTAFGAIVEGGTFFDGNGNTSGAQGILTAGNSQTGAGLRHFMAAHFGYRTSHFSVAPGGTIWWTDGHHVVAPHLVLIPLGVNDRTAAVGEAVMRANLNTIVSRINTVADANGHQRPSIVFVATYVTGATNTDSDAYTRAAWLAALDNPGQCSVIDIADRFGFVGTGGDVAGLTADNIHPATDGHRWKGELIGAKLLEPLGLPAPADGPTDVPTPRTLGSGATQAMQGSTTLNNVPAAAGAVLPDSDITRDLGAILTRWANAYLLRVLVSAGTAGAPTVTSTGDLTSGMYFGGSQVNISAASTRVLQAVATALRVFDGSTGAPSLAGLGDTDTGLWWAGSNVLMFTTGGVDRWKIGAAGNFVPETDNAVSLGAATNRVTAVYSVQGVVSPVATVSASTVLTTSHYTVIVDASGGARTITLPTAVGISGRRYEIKKKDSSANAVTVAGNGAELVDAANTLALTNQYQSVTVVSDGTQWWIV